MLPKRKKEERETHPAPVFSDDWGPCKIEGCEGNMLRQTGYCEKHWMRYLASVKLEREKQAEASFKALNDPKKAKEKARYSFASRNRKCSKCGTFGFHTALEKPKNEQPKSPKSYDEILMVLCKDCKS